ncbi:Gfo/Idh/MocA family oxidoreductase [Helicobacter typhlonius]|uniref:Gfo/Idh/MocA family protein n=1 Tax=Helicobacter typhlonius TaxID=76936 RepID=UPI002FE191BD
MQKAVLIGRGYWGKILHSYIQKHYEICGIFGSDTKKQILKQALDNAESAFIATPLASHFALAKLALEHHCNVFVEKPSCATQDEFNTLQSLSQAHNKIFFTDYIYTFSQSILYALQILQDSKANIQSIEATITQYGNFYENESVLEVIGVHYLSVFAFMQELGLLENICVKECKFLDSKKQSALLKLHALQENKQIPLSLYCSLLSNEKKRILSIQTQDFTLHIDMLSHNPLQIHSTKQTPLQDTILPIFDEGNNLNFALKNFKDICEKRHDYTKHLNFSQTTLNLLTQAHNKTT